MLSTLSGLALSISAVGTGRYIRQLDGHLIDQIAAGEVVERPASIAKELVENAMDAGATSVQVDLEGGGLTRISVSDDGVGMGIDDLSLCWHRHATSKLSSASDLFQIETYGFRGEALSSIASISEMSITTRRNQDDSGRRLVVRAGADLPIEPVAAPRGTTIEVKDIFFNTPARKKFLRSPATEQAHVQEACLRVALGARRGGILLTSGTRRLLDIPPDAEGVQRAEIALGKRVKGLKPFEYQSEGIRVHGYVSGENVDRGDTKGIWFFVNGRYVRDRMLARVTTDAFRHMVDRGRYPNLLVYLDVNPEAIDVNVHPQKLEVRFSDGASVYRILAASLAVAAAVSSEGADETRPYAVESATHRFFRAAGEGKANYSVPERERVQKSRAGNAPARRSDSGYRLEKAEAAESRTGEVAESVVTKNAMAEDSPRKGLDAFVVGAKVIVVDVSRARRDLCFRRLSDMNAPNGAQQMLMLPPVLELSGDVSSDHLDVCQKAGFQLEWVGPGRLGLISMPSVIPESEADSVASTLGVRLSSPQLSREALIRAVCQRLFETGADYLDQADLESLIDLSGESLYSEPPWVEHDVSALAGRLKAF
ncbi:MAG: DNA mismatch repair endonuclease MutL [Myxococcota bacterium]|nr:DNA mismatch repair endonuclease MutL [Myxococcota bacterium]